MSEEWAEFVKCCAHITESLGFNDTNGKTHTVYHNNAFVCQTFPVVPNYLFPSMFPYKFYYLGKKNLELLP